MSCLQKLWPDTVLETAVRLILAPLAFMFTLDTLGIDLSFPLPFAPVVFIFSMLFARGVPVSLDHATQIVD